MKIKQFAGIDIGAAFSKRNLKTYYALLDSIKATNAYLTSLNQISTLNTDSLIFHTTIHSNIFILNPFYGLQFHFSKKWFLSAQLGFDFPITNYKVKSIVNNGKDYNYTNGLSFAFNTSGIVNSLSICYKF